MADEPNADQFCKLLLHYPAILAKLTRLAGCPHLGNDLTQETYGRAFRFFGSGTRIYNPAAWLHAIAWNVARDHFRRARDGPLVLGSDELERVLEVAEAHVEPPALAQVDLRSLEEAVDRLPPIARSLILGFYFEGKGCAALGLELGIRRDNVKVRLYRARKQLRKLLRRSAEGALSL